MKRAAVFAASLGLLIAPGAFAAAPNGSVSTAPDDGAATAIRTGTADGTDSRVATNDTERQRSGPQSAPNAWSAYLEKLRAYVQSQPLGRAAQALTKSAEAGVGAETGDLDLNFTGSFTDYPNGVGSGSGTGVGVSGNVNNTFTNLRQYGEVRLNWQVLSFFARRPGRIDSARASAEEVHYQNAIDALAAQKTLLDEQVSNWAAVRARRALDHALTHAKGARHKLGLAQRSPTARITQTTLAQVESTATLYERIQGSLAGLPTAVPAGPRLPVNYSTLPLRPPSATDIQQVAQQAPQVELHLARSRAAAGLADSYWGNGVDVMLYGGYIAERRQGEGGIENGPEVGLRLTVPIGSGNHARRVAAHWQARAEDLQAHAATRQRRQFLRQLSQKWASDAASLQAAEAAMQQQAEVLHRMHVRTQHSASGLAPEPGAVDAQAAQFWFNVGQVWTARAQWVRDVLTWALLDPGYLRHSSRPANAGTADSLCAPLKSCESG